MRSKNGFIRFYHTGEFSLKSFLTILQIFLALVHHSQLDCPADPSFASQPPKISNHKMSLFFERVRLDIIIVTG
jgi:hypothetical protein